MVDTKVSKTFDRKWSCGFESLSRHNFMANDYSANLIKEYSLWEVYVHENQGYLGRCVIVCKREDALDLTQATSEEQLELFLILQNLKKASEKLFQPDWFNYAFLGNEFRHLHGHFIPRYAKLRIFNDVQFEDKLYGHNYKTDKSFKTSSNLLASIRDGYREILG